MATPAQKPAAAAAADGLDVAVIGMAGRFPGAADVAAYWKNLREGVESIREIPEEELRAAGVPESLLHNPRYLRAASRLEGVDLFDADFFGYAPKEAAAMDPQSRLFLETAWQALEDAGCDPARCAGAVGVFAASSLSTYLLRNVHSRLDPREFILSRANLPHVLGNGQDFLATRVSYKLNLRGPSIDVQTACSSALVAIHMARQSLLNGECDVAIAGGVSIYLPQDTGYLFEDGLILSNDGHCRVFDRQASGTIFGRGVGAVVLKPLAEALADGDRVLAVIKGSAVNNDGADKVGFTAPSVNGQAAVVAEALANAGVGADAIGYIEAHGTGTTQGDPIEIAALTQAFRRTSDANGFCRIGSVKSNIGHLDAASGVASFIKVVLMLMHGQIPPSLHFEAANPEIDFPATPFVVNTALQAWARRQGARRAGVSSFGMGGTNAHLVLEESPALAGEQASRNPEGDDAYEVLTLSARSEPALRRLTTEYALLLEQGAPLADVCFTANTGRTRFNHRCAVAGASAAQLAQQLREVDLHPRPAASTPWVNRVDARPGAAVSFLFTGQGSQYVGMGRELYRREPVFRGTFDQCAEILGPLLDTPLTRLVFDGAGGEGSLDRTALTQPALFAVEYSLARLWLAWGVQPKAMIGHSLGEYVAACIAGVWSLEDALKLVARRARLMQALPAGGGMAAVLAAPDQVTGLLREIGASGTGAENAVEIAAINGPRNTVISGRLADVDDVLRRCEARGIESRKLNVSHAFHSRLMEPMLADFARFARTVKFSEPAIPIVSNRTGKIATAAELTNPEYWCEHLRQPVQFVAGMQALAATGCRCHLEIGPQPVLTGMGRQVLASDEHLWVPTLVRGVPDHQRTREVLGQLFVNGVEVDWPAVTRGQPRRRVALPGHPLARQRHWIDMPPPTAPGPSARTEAGRHPLVQRRIRSPLTGAIVYQSSLDDRHPDYLGDHRIHGATVVPMTAYLEMAVAAGRDALHLKRPRLTALVIENALVLPPGETRLVQLSIFPEGGGARFEIHAAVPDQDRWTLQARGLIGERPAPGLPAAAFRSDEVRRQCGAGLTSGQFYEALAARHLEYGTSFRGVDQLWPGAGVALGRIKPVEGWLEIPAVYGVHPAHLDACLHVVLAAVWSSDEPAAPATFLPVGFERFDFDPGAGPFCWSRAVARRVDGGGNRRMVDVQVLDEAGRVAAEISGIELRRTSGAALARLSQGQLQDWMYEVDWQRRDDASSSPPARLPGALQLGHTVDGQLEAVRARHGLGFYEALLPRLDRLCYEYVCQAFRQLGWLPPVGATGTLAEVCGALGVLPQHRRFVRRWLEILAEEGDLELHADAWKVTRLPARGQPEKLADELQAEFPQGRPELSNLRRCAGELARVVHGEADPLELLFPRGSLSELQLLYQDSLFTKGYNELVGSLFSAIAGKGGRLRVLEIGAGTGSTTAAVLAALGHAEFEYVFTDISPLLVAHAEEKFRGRGVTAYRILDAEKDPRDQGFAPGSFDVVLASNAVHTTADIAQTMRHAKLLLRPGGLLVLVEGIARQRWVDLIFGMTDGWWRFADFPRRGNYPLLSLPQWRELLGEVGFADTVAVPDESRLAALFFQAIIVAQAPAAPEIQPADAKQPCRWLILADRGGLGGRLAEALAARGDASVLLYAGEGFEQSSPSCFRVDPTSREDFARVLGALPDPGHLRGAIHLWSLDASPAEESTPAIAAEQRQSCGGLLSLVQALARGGPREGRSILLVTRGCQAVGAEAVAAAVSPWVNWGLAKVAELEHPDLSLKRVDLDPLGEGNDEESVLRELFSTDREEQVAYRQGARHVARLRLSGQPGSESRPVLTPPAGESYRLITTQPGVLENLALQPAARRRPGPGEVEIQVAYTGLNFLDVLGALEMAPVGPRPLGNECSGFVTAVGTGVQRLHEGDAVAAYAPDSFSSFVTIDARFVIPKPTSMSLEEAATVPGAFLTAHYALNHFGRMKRGDRVLIHAATGGVGMAAVQLAQRAGAEIFATAGSERKRAVLRSLGIEHVMDSRSLDFSDEVLARTGGRGVDVVLNCLAGEFIGKSVAALHGAGRFLEIGKTNVWSAARFHALRPRAEYRLVDLSADIEADPALAAQLFSELGGALAAGELRPLPKRTFSIRHASRAFRFMAQARHIGKVVISRPHGLRPTGSAAGDPARLRLRPDGAYLVTGGLGGLGRPLTRWLAERGARHVTLLSRRPPSAEVTRELGELRANGPDVTIESADVADFAAMRGVLQRLQGRGHPLRGVIHAAGALDDGVLQKLHWPRFRHVFSAKVDGAWNLHCLTRDQPLDFFVLFSSVASLFGSPGQGNHSAANAFLDGLAHHRRTLGLEGTSINWGAWAEIGAFAERNVGAQVAARGIGTFGPDQGFAILEAAMLGEAAQLGVAPVDWRQFRRQYPADRVPRFYDAVGGGPAEAPAHAAPDAPAASALLEGILAAPAARRRKLLVAFVQDAAGRTLGAEPARLVDLRRPLSDLGMDSLLAVEMRNQLGVGLGLQTPLPIGLLFDCPTIEALTQYLDTRVFSAAASAPEEPAAAQPAPREPNGSDLENLSDEEAEALLRRELGDGVPNGGSHHAD